MRFCFGVNEAALCQVLTGDLITQTHVVGCCLLILLVWCVAVTHRLAPVKQIQEIYWQMPCLPSRRYVPRFWLLSIWTFLCVQPHSPDLALINGGFIRGDKFYPGSLSTILPYFHRVVPAVFTATSKLTVRNIRHELPFPKSTVLLTGFCHWRVIECM